MIKSINYIYLFIPLFFIASQLLAKVEKIEIDSRKIVLQGKTFNGYGPYEMIKGRVYFSFDPTNPHNQQITDIELAPRNDAGRVEAHANIVILQPVANGRSREVALIEVSNRGGKFSPYYYMRARTSTLVAGDSITFGDALLMRMGLAVVWVGWQFDVSDEGNNLRLTTPIAQGKDADIEGLVRSDWTLNEGRNTLKLGHRQMVSYPVSDFDDPANQLTVRTGREALRRLIPRSQWKFAIEEDGKVKPDSTHIYMEDGFEAGKIYELVYKSKDPPIVGLGLAAIRDIISYFKYTDNKILSVEKGVAAGVSQTGRFLRHFLYQHFNVDEQGRKAYDGMMIITAGAGRGSFNHRFAQPSRDAHRYSAFFYPTDIFPFTSSVHPDPISGKEDGLLAKYDKRAMIPKIFYVNTGYEYWGRAAALIHVTPDGKKDVLPASFERIYHLSSGQHFVGAFPPREEIGDNVYRGNPLDFSVNYRALMVALVKWIDESETPPPSQYPTFEAGTLVSFDQVAYPDIPNLTTPATIHVAYRVDYGPRWEDGIIDLQPPGIGNAFSALVSKVDSLGNEMAGIRNVELQVPLATYLPWNLRIGLPGETKEISDFVGTYIPFYTTPNLSDLHQDPRPAIKSLYADKVKYLERIREAAENLATAGYVLREDIDYLVNRSERYWDWIFSGE